MLVEFDLLLREYIVVVQGFQVFLQLGACSYENSLAIATSLEE